MTSAAVDYATLVKLWHNHAGGDNHLRAAGGGASAWDGVVLSGSTRVANTTLASRTMSSTLKHTGLKDK